MELKTLDITSCQVKRRGVKGDREWVLWELRANDPQTGMPVSEELVAWREIPLGQALFEVEVKDDPKYGVSWNLRPAGGSGGSTHTVSSPTRPSIDVAQLEARVTHLEEEVHSLRLVTKTVGNGGPSTDVPANEDPIPF